MTAQTLQPVGSLIFASATRITPLDTNGYPVSGVNTYTTNTLLKATLTPVLETGTDVSVVAASGDLSGWAKHPDMVKYYTMAIELTRPDPVLEAVLAGGTVLTDSTTALGVPSGLTVTGQTTLGTIGAGTYGYRATQYNGYGESLAEAEVTVTNTGTTSRNVLSGVAPAAGALGVGYYGRTPGGEQLLGYRVNIGSQATSAASGTTPTTLSVNALTKPIPAGFEFTIAGDTNSPKIVFTTTAEAGIGAISLSVTTSSTPITTIAAGAIQPVFVDDGSLIPSGGLPTNDLTAGPGSNVGYQAPALGTVGNPNGVALEFWMQRSIRGQKDPSFPYVRILFPKVVGLHQMPRDLTNANMVSAFEGQAWENPNFGSGPFGDWNFDSTKVFQRALSGPQILPPTTIQPTAALY